MNLDKLISVVAATVVIAATTGQLPKMLAAVRKAQIQLIQETKASNWGMPMQLRVRTAP